MVELADLDWIVCCIPIVCLVHFATEGTEVLLEQRDKQNVAEEHGICSKYAEVSV